MTVSEFLALLNESHYKDHMVGNMPKADFNRLHAKLKGLDGNA